MLSRAFYYAIKPYLPWRVRMVFRRIVAKRRLARSHAIWPIDQAAARVPSDWPGWPEGKKFAVVLTHDVEGPKGLAQCRRFAEVEKALGYRSSFNFIPEGSYVVPSELRQSLTADGFEVGVHDLEHDGHLYDSRHGFERKAMGINRYLREWSAVGFRSGFMLRNLDWIHRLDIQYDLSTFDTDPFEPQPESARTIFPFWVPTPGGDPTADAAHPGYSGYAELPYTLPQDSTLFLLLQEKTNAIWRQKLDWVAQHGGMVLLNVHPDYLSFGGKDPDHPLCVEDHYTDLLRYLTKTYGSTFWPALPRDVSAFVHRWKNQAGVAGCSTLP